MTGNPQHPLERLRLQIEAAEEYLKSIKCPYSATSGSLTWKKGDSGEWTIFFKEIPLRNAPAAAKIEAVDMISGLRIAILEAKKDAMSDAGLAAVRLEYQLRMWRSIDNP